MLAMLAAAVLAAQSPTTVTNPTWERKPAPDELPNAYPDRALAKGIEGQVVILCTADTYGDLDDCKVVSEQPQGWGFGDAALRLAFSFHMRPQLRNGLSEPSQVRVPIHFALPPSTPRPPATTPGQSKATLRGWPILLAGGLGATLLIAAAGDLLARRSRTPVRAWSALASGFGFIGVAWRGAAVPLLIVLALNAVGDLKDLIQPRWLPLTLIGDLLLYVIASLMVTAAMYRAGFRRLRPDEPRFRPGLLGLRLGVAEVRIFVASILGFLVVLFGGVALTVMTAVAAAGASLAARQLGAGDLAARAAAIVELAGGGGPVLLAVFLASMILIGSRLITFIPQVVFDPEIDLGSVWRTSRGGWLAAILAEAGLWILAFLLALVLGLASRALAPLVHLGPGLPSYPIVRAGVDSLIEAIAIPLRAGVSLYFFQRFRGLERAAA